VQRILSVGVLGLALAAPLALDAQSKAPVTRADYGQWESVSLAGGRGGGGGFSPDGKWLAYSLNRVTRGAELHLLKLADGTTKVVPFGGAPVFSADLKWAAYSIGQSEAEQERLRAASRPVQNSLGLFNLTTGESSTVEGVESFTFSADGGYLAMRRYSPAAQAAAGGGARGGGVAPAPAPGGRGGAAGGAADDAPGGTLIVRQLVTGRETTFGNVSAFEWQTADRSHLLAMTISADGRTGNGVQLFNPEQGILRVLDSAPLSYTGLTWRGKSSDLAVLRAATDDRREGPTYNVLTWNGVGLPTEHMRVYDPAADASFPAGMRIVSYRRLSWSDDASTIFFGLATWDDRVPARGTPAGPARGTGAAGRGAAPGALPADEPATVDIWHWSDVDVMARQKLSAAADRRRNLLAAWHLDSGNLVPIGKSFSEQVTPIRRTQMAYVAEWSAYAMDRSIGRPAADLYLADLGTGLRTRLRDNVIDRYVQVSPNGKYLLFLQDDQYWTINLTTRAAVNITKNAATSFVDKDSDETVKQKPPFGVAGWTKDDAAVILYDKFDLWQVAADGAKSTRLTSGAAEEVRHRYIRVNPDDEWIDPGKPLYLTLFGVWSKKSGYGVLRPGTTAADRAIWLDKSVGGLSRAKDADVFAYTVQDYDDSPDLFAGGPDLRSARQVTTTNEFQSNYAWGRSEIVEYKSDKGQRLQGALYYPAGYDARRKYPMIVTVYERESDGVHRYVAPSDRDYYNTTVFTSQGYFVLEPDIAFRPREPGLSVVECVTPAVKKVVQMGVVDAKRVGVVGHSWGGFDTAFLATHTTDVFAAAIAGAPITDLVSNYGNHHWSSGIAETDHIETGQQRMEVPLYEDLPAYIRNSAVFGVQNMTTPLLIEVGDADGTVFWHQGVELYNIARRAGKSVVMLVYNGEDHGLRQKKNQVDYQQRILAWFGHYLKDEPGASWITNGESFLKRADELRRIGGGGAP
jgi:dipeptidyl aminopeptidase/acylaminoacyl peptidase